MKFKREDLGLYFAMMLLGAGAGLLIGSIIANRLEARREAKEAEEEEDIEPLAQGYYVDEFAQVMNKIAEEEEEEEEEENEDLKAARLEALEIAEEEEYIDSVQIDKFNKRTKAFDESEYDDKKPAKKHVKQYSREKIRPRENRSKYTVDELIDFEATYEPQVYMVDMLWGGTMTFEQVLGVIEAEESALTMEVTDYNGPYRNVFEDTPEVNESNQRVPPPPPLTSHIYGVVDTRWTLMADPPDTYDEKMLREIVYDPDEDGFFLLRSGAQIPFEIKSIGGEPVWEKAQEYMDNYQRDNIVIDDGLQPRYYILHRIKSDAAEAAEDLANESD